MNKTTKFLVAAGSAFGLATVATAQSSNLDLDRAYSAELSADAAARTSQLQGGTAGNDGFFYIGDGTGNYRLNMSGVLQFRYTMNFRDDQGTPDNDTTIGFNVPSGKLKWHGNIINPNWKFRLDADFADDQGSGSFNLGNAYGQYDFEGMEGGFLRFGQFKLPIIAEELIEREFQLAADRSMANEFFNQDYSQGLMFGYMTDSFAVYAAFSDGIASRNTAFNSAAEADWALTGRVDVKLQGDWERFDDFTSWRGSDFAARIGGAIHWQSTGDTNPELANDAQYLLYTIDVALEGNGWHVFGAFIGDHSDLGGGTSDVDNFGHVLQAGVFLNDQWELFGRWDGIYLDNNITGPGDDDFHFLTFGVNHYIVPESHAAKFTLDLQWALNDTAPNLTSVARPFGSQAAHFNTRTTQLFGDADDGEVTIRAQIQLVF
ncbi:MAG: hypothetical protein KF757_06135 [Phycisphaeraceae bacterium]|nr:hypothetical protein [Phycisphaeraceae bacterium]